MKERKKSKRETIADFKPAKTIEASSRLSSMTQHVSKIKTSGACRFPG